VGVWPFDLSKIKPAAVEPSEATKVDGRFPVPVESPVKVIEAGLSQLAAMNPPCPILTLPAIPPSLTSSTPVNASSSSSTQTLHPPVIKKAPQSLNIFWSIPSIFPCFLELLAAEAADFQHGQTR